MSRWKLFGKSKSKKEEPLEYPLPTSVEYNEDITMETGESQQVEKEQEQTDQPLAEYHETLHTGKPASSNSASTDQRIWRDVKAIEENIDKMHVRKSRTPTSKFDKKVDQIIKKREKK